MSPVPPTGPWYTTQAPPGDAPETPATPFSTVTDAVCPTGGLISTVGFTDAALGLRWASMTVTNCGSAVQTVTGYPELTVVDEYQRTLEVTVKPGEAGSDGTPLPRPQTFRLNPGESLQSHLTWRNTIDVVDEDRSVKAGGVRLTSGDFSQVFMSYLDIGSAGEVYVSPWGPASGA